MSLLGNSIFRIAIDTNFYDSSSDKLYAKDIEGENIGADHFGSNQLSTSVSPAIWSYDSTKPSLGKEQGSGDMTGNLDMSGNSYPGGTNDFYPYALIFTKPFPTNHHIRVTITPSNEEGAQFRYFVDDKPTAGNPTSYPHQPPGGWAGENSQFVLWINNPTSGTIANPNFNYLVVSHPK